MLNKELNYVFVEYNVKQFYASKENFIYIYIYEGKLVIYMIFHLSA